MRYDIDLSSKVGIFNTLKRLLHDNVLGLVIAWYTVFVLLQQVNILF